MNENLNLEEILKDCPEGTELYSTMFGEVKLDYIENGSEYPINVKSKSGVSESFTLDGKYCSDYDGECTLFPSRDQRDWSKFNHKKEELVPPCEFKDGDILSYQCGYLKNRTIYIYRYNKIMNTSYYVALSGNTDSTFMISNKEKCDLNGYNITVRFATEEEKQKLFDAIKLNGYKWNAETKTLEKLVEPKFKIGDKIVNSLKKYIGDLSSKCIISEITDDKYIFTDGSYILINEQDIWKLVPDNKDKFDPKTLKPFDKVLARHGVTYAWECTWYSHFVNNTFDYYYMCAGLHYSYCIPYNDDTKYLVGTTEEVPDYYKYWED